MAANISATNDTLSNGVQCMKDSFFKGIGEFLSVFYIISPIDSIKDDPYDVPDYEIRLIIVGGFLFSLEQFIRYKGKNQSRFEDVIINTGSAMMFTLLRVFLLTSMIIMFVWIHNNMRIVDLPLHSVWTWLLSLLLVEFTYYWTHRALHELNILWAAHQFHHMAEDVNISTTVRDSMIDLIIYSFFPLPLAIIIPPQILLVHVQFSLIYQLWLHNEVVGNLGFIEYIINTPSQHRVHHGKNPCYIDKNYGALLMIWDRMFGTHQTEKDDIVFGVVSATPQTYDSMTLQFSYYRDVWNKFNKVEGIGNKISAILKGPGWSPGKPRLGNISEVPEPNRSLPKYSHNPFIPSWKKVYVGLHGCFVVLGFFILADHPYIRYSPGRGFVAILYIIFLLTSFGAIFDNRNWAPFLEIIRCVAYIPFDYYLIASVNWQIGPMQQLILCVLMWTIRACHMISILFWIGYWCASKDTKDDKSYAEVPTGEKIMEIDRKESGFMVVFKTILLIFSLFILIVAFNVAWMLRLDSCAKMFNEWY